MDRYQKFIQEKARKKRELMGRMFFPRTPVLFIPGETTFPPEARSAMRGRTCFVTASHLSSRLAPLPLAGRTDFVRHAPEFALVNDLLEGFNSIGLHTIITNPASLRQNKQIKGDFLHYVAPEDEGRAFEAADFALLLSGNPSVAMKYGCVPISKFDGEKTSNYNPLQEKGNGFYFKNKNKWDVFAATVRALETYQFMYDWENLIREILKERGN